MGAAPAAGCSGSCRDPPAVPFGAGRCSKDPSLLRRVTCGPERHVIRAAQRTSREGQNPAQEARAHFCPDVLGGWSPTSGCRPVRLLGRVHFFFSFSYFLSSRHYESSAKECERSEVFFHNAGVMRDPRKSTEGNLGTEGRDIWLEVNGSYRGSKADSERYQVSTGRRWEGSVGERKAVKIKGS